MTGLISTNFTLLNVDDGLHELLQGFSAPSGQTATSFFNKLCVTLAEKCPQVRCLHHNMGCQRQSLVFLLFQKVKNQ